MKILKISMLALGTSLCGLAQADVIGIKADVSYWFYDGKAQVKPKSTSLANQTGQDNLLLDPYMDSREYDLDRKGSAQLSLAFEHPIPLIPNAKIRHVNLKTQTENEVLGQPIYDLDIAHTDFILYYEILDNIVDADVGFGATSLNGDVKTLLADPTSSFYKMGKVDIDKTIPVIYGSAGVKLPFTGLSAKGELLYSNFNDTKITDAQAELQYNFIDNLLVDVGLKAGYRILDIKLDDYEKNDLKFNFKGPYIGIDIHF
ncbi:TIGR04219 family outer membrane beta-barrel protein [Acinetobacter sp. NIPH 2699]|uniref:TIGR04219 family outer membrane beta-barrel protein n=1 Tax=Acinetobacter sp. NIPH 2699 TaxID=2923433 RepID=UPI001F4B95A8|nr:TIGR04219 family outer membrane beta-barrel protein [Acinetobacter sp. NIPH 2699]MCH7335597.1 TIGR04219 family outer membrane beta-barrel protein [Acinetobacter sp. NIPH 2699]